MWSSRTGRLPLLGFALLLLGGAGCGGAGPDRHAPVERVAAGELTVGGASRSDRSVPHFTAEPRVEDVTLDDERRPALVLPADGPDGTVRWSWRTGVPDGGRLQVGLGSPDGRPVEGTIALRRGDEREILEVIEAGPRGAEGLEGGRWRDAAVDLSAHAGSRVTLELTARMLGSAAGEGDDPAAEVAWAPVDVTGRRPAPELRREGRPNILVIVVDTLRYDHITPYGYARETSPRIQELLADAGTVVEEAYSQAPWTLPSVASYLTSRNPGEFLAGEPATFGIPEEMEVLTEILAGLGYRTGGFIGNPTLRVTNGFGRGFETFYTPSSMQAMAGHADELNRRALPWLHAHRDEPFFLYVHYVDPHDPYWNPDMVDGRSPYFEDPGGISGRWIHGVYAGRIEVPDLERQIRHFTALYDTEIRFADRAIGELLDSIPPEVLRETLVVLTSDHGEELYDHGGWKHGHTLYEDQIHIPLILRWDDRLPAGSRLPGTVRLLDLAPTLVSAAGGEPPASWRGTDLLPALTGEGPLPRLAAFAQHLNSGPLRVATVLEGEKLILFNRREPFQPRDGLQEHLYRVDMSRLERLELYDLEADPREQRNLLAPERLAREGPPPGIERLDAVLHHQLHRSLRGVRALADALPEGARLAGELRFAGPPQAALPLGLGPEASLDVDGARVRFEIVGGPVAKGFLLPGEPRRLVSAELRLDGEPLPAGRLRYGAGTPYTGRPLEAAAFDTEAFPDPGDVPGLRLWRYSGERPDAQEIDPETRRSLEALGYIQ